MCGFAALFEPERAFAPTLLGQIDRDLFHRGPDSGGRASEPGWALVFRRLAILDPTSGADQPMSDPSGRFTLVYNGEIYNFRELRAALEAEGARFRTNGDTEVLLQGYMHWGEAVLDRLEGMYAFVLIDREQALALAARDPLGIKPLYMARRGSFVGFASEMRPLQRLVGAEPDPDALAEHLVFNWAAGRLSNFKHVERVPGGTVITLRLGDAAVRERRFCDPLSTLEPDESLSPAEAETRATAALEQSVAAHLASDVGYALQLSGGIDSSLVAALAAPRTPFKLASFGISLGDDYEHDEAEYRRMVVKRHGLDHREIAMDGVDFADALPRAVRHMEGPSPHFGCVLLMRLCDHIREVSKVVLTGEGGDEFFGGYQRYEMWRKLAWQERLGRLLPRGLWPRRRPFLGIRRLAGLDGAVYASVYHDFHAMHGLFPGLVPKPGAREAASRRFRDFRDRMTASDQVGYLESLLVRQDKMAMAASVEARVPLVHLRLACVVNGLPRRVRVPGGVTKPLLKKIAEAHLPRELIHRRKVGLVTPVDRWVRDERALGRYLGALTDPNARLAQYTEPGTLRRFVDDARAGRLAEPSWPLRLINIELWLRSVGEEASPSARTATA